MAVDRSILEFPRAGEAHVVTEATGDPGPGEVMVKAEFGAVSPGSETLVYSGRAPEEVTLDESMGSIGSSTRFPIRYGYILVGRVAACGANVDADVWLERRVYAFHPHATHAVVPLSSVIPIPDEVPSDLATLYANTETALSLHWDAAILVGEPVLVVGLGIVGMLVARIAAERAAGAVFAVDADANRREWARRYLAGNAPVFVVPSIAEAWTALGARAEAYRGTYAGFDAVFELTGAPAALDEAIGAAGFAGRVIVGSWYGSRPTHLNLGGRFHRARIHVLSSQVSTIPAGVRARIDHGRRTRITWNTLTAIADPGPPCRRVAFWALPNLYRELAERESKPEPWILITYNES